ncbi:3-dehydroquinate synthase [Ilyomonas limi]|uniref:3-dehydroquinate synthase n=1 Tax=Ilyomonas limi TaxID=2575867 RepID=A0A4V5UVI0_9BACT|nr:3-dehydroquinate synthase [Ilyomonas limi]TKK64923.1 3-dehydroquinate synthase [Ilyomonas limi]
MTKKKIDYTNASTTFYFDASLEYVEKITSKESTIVLTDENIFAKNKKRFKGWKTIVIKAGEQYKNQATVDDVIGQMISLGADRKTMLIGVGGGVITDMAGYIAGVYMRGIPFGFVPTSILAMVDACIGGKNGVDVGVYKNMVGLIRQPSFLLYDYSLLKSLPKQEWVNGFAEIIKHAAIKDAAMFKLLEQHKLSDFQKDAILLNKLIQRNAMLKSKVVQEDEFEKGERKLLNYGHTLGHAIENDNQLPHGFAVTIGMVAAAHISEQYTGFNATERLVSVIKKYGLPTYLQFNMDKALQNMMADKKRFKNEVHYVLLEKIGKAIVQPLTIEAVKEAMPQP